jgi:hypothetical protein
MSEQQQPQNSGEQQVTPSSEQQPVQQPAPVSPEQPATEPAPTGEQVGGFEPAQPGDTELPAGDPNETTDAGDGAGDQPTPAEVEQVGDVSEPAPPENEHASGDQPGSAGLGVSGKFVHDEPDAGAEDAGDQ